MRIKSVFLETLKSKKQKSDGKSVWGSVKACDSSLAINVACLGITR